MERGAARLQGDQLWPGAAPPALLGYTALSQPNNGVFPNGWFEGARTNLNAVMTFRCHPGMKFEGEKQQATCRYCT